MPPITETSFISPILAGRDDAVAALRRWLEQAHDGIGKTVLISGEAGIGKSRLVREAKVIAAELGFVVMQGNCYEEDRALPFAPFVDLLRRLEIGFLRKIRFLDQLLKLAPDLAPKFPNVQPTPIAEPEREKRNLFRAWVSLLIEGSDRSERSDPYRLIIIEDLHWCDDVSLELLLQLARAVTTQPVVLVLTYRSDETTPSLNRLLAQLDRERLAHETALKPLTQDSVEAMVRAIFQQTQPISHEFVQVIHSLTEGNPFFVEEVLKSLVEVGDVFYANGRWDRKKLGELRAPRTVRVAVAQRTETLSGAAKRVLSVAAVIGQHFDVSFLQTLTAMAESQLLDALRELMAAQLVVEGTADQFAFRHTLTREAMYSSLLKRERRALHLAVGEALERAPVGEHDAALSYHFFEAEAWDKTLTYARRTGEQAQAVFAPREAIAHFTRAIEAEKNLRFSENQSFSLHSARGKAREQVGEFDDALADFEAALAVAQSNKDTQKEWQALHDLGFLWVSRDYVKAGEYFERTLAMARLMQDSTALAHSLNRVANRLVNLDQADEALRYHHEALRIFQSLGDRQGEAATHDLLGLTGFMSNDVATGIAHYEQAMAQFRALNDQGGLLGALLIYSSRHQNYMGNTAVWMDVPLTTRLQDGERALSMARESGARPAEALALWSLGIGACTAGQYGAGLRWLEQAVALARELEHGQFAVATEWALGAALQDVLQLDEAHPYLERAYKLSSDTHSVYMQRIVAAHIASSLVQQGKLNDAAALLARELPPNLPMRTSGQRHLWCAQAEWLLAKRDAGSALELLDELIGAAPNVESGGRDAIPRLSRLRGEALAISGRYDEAEATLVGAIAFAHPWKPMLWRLNLSLGNVLRRQNRRDEADHAYAQARDVITTLANEIEDTPRRERFIARATALFPTATSKQAAKREHDGLTAREREVAVLIAQGKTNREIAEGMIVSLRTVDNHVANILSKLGFGTRAQVAVWAAQKWTGKNSGVPDEEN